MNASKTAKIAADKALAAAKAKKPLDKALVDSAVAVVTSATADLTAKTTADT